MPPDTRDFDKICEYAINFLLTLQGNAKRLAVDLVRLGPQSPALEVVFVLSIAASSIEEVLASPESTGIAVDAWRVAALLGVDLHMMQKRGLSGQSCADLMQYWQTVDGYFLS